MNGGQVSLLYDGLGTRVAKAKQGVTTRYLVDDLSPTGYPQVVEELTNGVVQREYTYGLQRISQNQSAQGVWTPSFYEYDGGGNVRLLTNSSGAVTDTYEYDAFGNLISTAGTTPNEFYYRGEQYDADLGFYYLRARYYNPATGRFVTQDPWGGDIYDPASLHRYRYAKGNPANYIDPSGQGAISEYAFNLGLKYGDKVAAVYELGQEIACVYFTLAAGVDVVNHWIQRSAFQNALGIGTVVLSVAGCTAFGEETGGTGPPELEPVEPGEPLPGEPGEPGGGCCFAAGTPVHTDHGDVPVEKIAVGDQVLSRNRESGKLELKSVIALTPPHQDKLLEMRIAGERDPLRPSTTHPFWVRRGYNEPAWIEAGKMRAGDLVQSIQGDWRRVMAITQVEAQETVYNFTVDQNHDYFVGETGFLVHNAKFCGPCGRRRTPQENREARNFFKNNKQEARDQWEGRDGNQWPNDENGMPWPAEHTPSLKEGGDPMNVYPRDPGAPDPHNIPGPNGLTDYQIWGALGTAARIANQLCDLE